MNTRMSKFIIMLSNFGYIAACLILYLIALCILVSAVWGIICDMTSGSYSVYNLLDEVALIVFAMAVVDISKYLMIEEVLKKNPERSNLNDSKESLTKFTIIIASALSLEGLVITIEVAKQDVTKILYPIGLLFAAIFYIVGIGIYQKLSNSDEDSRIDNKRSNT
ncbi:general glycosylation pathway protein [Candidatus Aerophobetes bacterium]|uniref:General glycosylation pathway protein n=1 Tax=Aerophobetes bacterium TaxID=2030807 RepID=A0A2A4X2X5_UNCAE|nr:MAG: general glycosylation pathway protein [Candidatus Aerophobetes bacterium]